MRQYTVVQAPILAFFSSSFYRDVGFHWKGTGFAYLILLLTICWVPIFIKFQLCVSYYVENKAPKITSQIPQISINKGEASVDVIQPYKITDPDSEEVLALIDTTGNKDSLVGTDARVILTRTEAIFKENNFETRSYSLKEIEHFSLDQQKVKYWMTAFRNYGAVVFFPFAVIGSFIFRIVQLLIYAAIGLLFAKWCKTSKSYLTLLRLSVMAITPVIILNTVIGIADVTVPLLNLINFIVAMVYLFLGVKSVSHQEELQISEAIANKSPIN